MSKKTDSQHQSPNDGDSQGEKCDSTLESQAQTDYTSSENHSESSHRASQREPLDSQHFLKNLTGQPGVYQMLSCDGEVLYVGKAQNLKRRVSSYFRGHTHNPRIASLVKQIYDIKIVITHSDHEAYLLENNLIKTLKPRYNILFRDDKSYAYIVMSKDDDFPRIDFYRGKTNENAYFYGPFTNTSAVRESLNLLQKLFKIRQCSEHFFRNRTRPCIQYQIERCTAPCVNYVSKDEYQQQIYLARLFLEGKNSELIQELLLKMQNASEQLQFEMAAKLRDQITVLRKLQQKQYIYANVENLDVIYIVQENNLVCVQMLMFRQGKLCANHSYFPKNFVEMASEELAESFISQHYQQFDHPKDFPKSVLLNIKLENKALLQGFLSELAGNKINIQNPLRGERLKLIEMAKTNAEDAVKQFLQNKQQIELRWRSLQQDLNLTESPNLLECFDISHMQGEATKASCVVFNSMGPDKKSYRRYNITDITPGDDYAAMEQVLGRRYRKILEKQQFLPDVVIVDGGRGQLNEAIKVFESIGCFPAALLAIAKGPLRKAGLETVFRYENQQITVVNVSQHALLLLQQIRDESHRFAITGHRQQRDKRRLTSPLQSIVGIGPTRRRALLNYFGGLQEIKRASIEEIAKVPGLSQALAKQIYDFLHQD